MFQPFQIQSIHHLTLTVGDVRRSSEFYTRLPGFQAVMEFGPRLLLAKGNIILALTHLRTQTRRSLVIASTRIAWAWTT